MATFEHKGIKIQIDSSGLFTVPSRPDVAAQETLEKTKARIDAVLKREQKPIQALMFGGGRWNNRDSVNIVNVTVTTITKRKWGGEDAWIKDHRGHRSKESLSDIYVDSVANRTTMEEVIMLRKDRKALDEKIEKTLQRLKIVAAVNVVDEVD